MADLSGAEIALSAYLKTIDGNKTAKEQDMRDFFLSLAQSWRSHIRKDAIIQHNDSDPHPFDEYRINGTVKNMDIFYEVFDIKEGAPMYLAPQKRVHIW